MPTDSEPSPGSSDDRATEEVDVRGARERARRRLAPVDNADGPPPDGREATRSSLWLIGSSVAVAAAAVFVMLGLWQVRAIFSQAREMADEMVAARSAAEARAAAGARSAASTPRPAAPAPSSAGTRSAEAAGAQPATPATPTAEARAPRVDGGPRPATAPEPVLAATGNLAKGGEKPSTAAAAAGAFEAQAEASEKVIPIGLEAAALAGSSALTLGQPPPSDYPRVGCDDVFVYIVTIAEGAPRLSAASIGIGKKAPARFRRPGETIGDWTVLAITDDWPGIEPDVWLEKDGSACRAELAGNPSRVPPVTKPRARPKDKKKKASRRRRR